MRTALCALFALLVLAACAGVGYPPPPDDRSGPVHSEPGGGGGGGM